MITYEEAQEIVSKYSLDQETETILFTDSLGRVLAADIKSDMDMPPFDKTAVDGYACRKVDLDKELVINEIIPAGVVATMHVNPGQCAKIMTGAAIPDGADWVFMVEDAVEENGRVMFTGTIKKDNISKKAEDINRGDVVLKKGRVIRPQDIAVMATVGATEVEVSKKVRMGIISTGSELAEPYLSPEKGQIRNSNAYQLIAQVIRSGADAIYYGIALDTEEDTMDKISRALNECNIVLLTGGVSMGDFDFVPKVLEEAGVKIIFDRVAVQPGKPTTFCVYDKGFVFGLPGNPVSAFVQFELFVRPFIHRAMKSDWTPDIISIPLASDYTRKRTERMAWVPVIKNRNGEAQLVDYHGSAHINALPDAWGIMSIGLGVKELKKGERVDVRQI